MDASVPEPVALVTDAARPAPEASSSTPAGGDDGSNPIGDYLEGLHDAGACEEQSYGTTRQPVEGRPVVLDALAQQCGPLEYFDFPSSCSEGARGCTTMVNSLDETVAARVLACVRAKRGAAVCAPGAVRDCVVHAMAPVRPRPRVTAVCPEIVRRCDAASKSLAEADCARLLSSMRKCHGFERAASCLVDQCDVGACLDDWIETYSY
jgi:hypothetical protein